MSTTQPIRSLEKLQLFENYFRYVKPKPRNYMLIIIGLNSALRISDILHLTYNDVYNYKEKKWRKHISIIEKKTGKRNYIYINNAILQVLEACADHAKHNPSDYLFISQMYPGQPLSRYQAYRLIRKAAVYAGFEQNVSCHSLRKTFGYHAWKQGTPPALLMNIYNHSSYQVTKRYLGIEQDDKDAVFEKIRL